MTNIQTYMEYHLGPCWKDFLSIYDYEELLDFMSMDYDDYE